MLICNNPDCRQTIPVGRKFCSTECCNKNRTYIKRNNVSYIRSTERNFLYKKYKEKVFTVLSDSARLTLFKELTRFEKSLSGKKLYFSEFIAFLDKKGKEFLAKQAVNLPANSDPCKLLMIKGIVSPIKFCPGCGSQQVANFYGYSKACSINCVATLKSVKLLRETTNVSKFGVKYVSQLPINRQSASVRLKDPKTQQIMAKALFEKYGVENISQSSTIHAKRLAALYNSKEYTLGHKKVLIQGYENYALDFLISEGLSFKEILLPGAKNFPTISYTENTKDRIYIPDIYIKKWNMIIEVKSSWTLFGTKDKFLNTARKAQATLLEGFNFQLMLFGSIKTHFVIVPSDWYTWEYLKFKNTFSNV
jgi:hypothetical protein